MTRRRTPGASSASEPAPSAAASSQSPLARTPFATSAFFAAAISFCSESSSDGTDLKFMTPCIKRRKR
jgi:hypothetical protein